MYEHNIKALNPISDSCPATFNSSHDKITFAYEMKDIVDYYNLYSSLMKYWNKLFSDFIFNIRYENLISNTKDQIRNLLNF